MGCRSWLTAQRASLRSELTPGARVCPFAMNIILAYKQASAEVEQVFAFGGQFVVLDGDADRGMLRRLG